ncbi:unnamed protein product [Dicrocoelium dendriticum]|nr:unnamed protein product [Dicrocoelium dendriticum]
MRYIVTANRYTKLKGLPGETSGLYTPKYTYNLKRVTRFMKCIERGITGNFGIRALLLKPHDAHHTHSPISVKGNFHSRPSQIINRYFAHKCANLKNSVVQYFMSVTGNAKAGTENVDVRPIGHGRSQINQCFCRSKWRVNRNESSLNFWNRTGNNPSTFGVLDTAGHNVIPSENQEVLFTPNAVSTFRPLPIAATSSNPNPLCEENKDAPILQVDRVSTNLDTPSTPASRLHCDVVQRLQSLMQRTYRERIQQMPETAKSDLFRGVSLEELVGGSPERDFLTCNTVGQDTPAIRFHSFGRQKEGNLPNATCGTKEKTALVSSHPEREISRLPKRLLKMSDCKRGNHFELSTGRTFARGVAGCDVIATQLVATRSEFVKYNSTCETQDGLGTPFSSQLLVPVTDLQQCHTPESKSASPSQATVEARPNVDEVRLADPLGISMGSTISTSPQVIPTHRTINDGVQTDLTEHSFVTHQLQLLKFCTLNAALHSGDMCSHGQLANLPHQERMNASKFFQNLLEDQPTYMKSWDSQQMEEQIKQSVQSTVTSMAHVNYTPHSSEATLHRSALRGLSPSDDQQEFSSPVTFMPSYVRRTDSWSYWPCAAPFMVTTTPKLNKEYTLEQPGLLSTTGRTGLKLFRRRRACNLRRSLVACSGESKHASSSESEETTDDTGSTDLSDMCAPKGSTRPEAPSPIGVPSDVNLEGINTLKLHGDHASHASNEQVERSSVLQHVVSNQPTYLKERLHPLVPASHSCRFRKPHLVRQHRVVDITIDAGYYPSKWSVESDDDLHSFYSRSDGNRMRLRQFKPANENVLNNGAVGTAASSPAFPSDKRRCQKSSTTRVKQFRTNLGLQANASKTIQRTSGLRCLNTPLQPMVPLRCRKCESPKVLTHYSPKGRRDSINLRGPIRPQSASGYAPRISHTMHMANEAQQTCKNHGGTSHSGGCTPIYGGRCNRRTTPRTNVANTYPTIEDLVTHCVNATRSTAAPSKTQNRKSRQCSMPRQTWIPSSGGVGVQDLQKLIEMYIADSVASSNLDKSADSRAKRPSAPGSALDHMCKRYLRTFGARPKSCEIKSLGTLPFVTQNSRLRKQSAPPDGLRMHSSCSGKSFDGSMNATQLFIGGGTQNAEFSEVSMESHKDTVMFSCQPSPRPDPRKMVERSESEQYGFATLSSVNRNFTGNGALDDASSSQLRAVDQRIGEALHGTLERILFDAADQLASLATSTQSSRSLKLVSRLDFIEDSVDDSTIDNREPCVIRSYEFVHQTPQTSSGDQKSKTILVNRQPVVIGARYSEESSSSLLKQRTGSGLWCCAHRTKEYRARSR